MDDLIGVQLQQQWNRATALENAARLAHQTSAHETSGAGWTAPKDPIYFDTRFITQPAVFHGSYLLKPPDFKHYKYPQITGGVTDWIVKDGLYVGAHLFFSVQVEPIRPPRTDGSNLTALQAQLLDLTISDEIIVQNKLIAEAKEAQYLLTHPAQCVVQHDLLFMAVGLKGMPSDIESELFADVVLTPLTPPIYANGQ